jgi:hypothetical protein
VGGSTSYRIIQDTEGWMREMEKRLHSEERRPIVRSAADLLGPGFGPKAIEIQDWNDEVPLFNGFYFSEPGALHSPNDTTYWIGYTVCTPDGWGYQYVANHRDGSGLVTDPAIYIRTFYASPTAAAIFSAWARRNQPSGSIRRVALFSSGNPITIVTAVETNLATVTIPLARTGYTYRAMFQCEFNPNTTGMYTSLYMRWGDNTPMGTAFAHNYTDYRLLGRIVSITCYGSFTYTGADNASTIQVAANISGGAGGAGATSVDAPNGRVTTLWVDEITP